MNGKGARVASPQLELKSEKHWGGHNRVGARSSAVLGTQVLGTQRVHGAGSEAGGCDGTAPLNLQGGVASSVWGYVGPGSQLPLSQALPASPEGQRAKERLERA